MSKLIDFLGRIIRAGDLIVYPWRRGSQMGLNKMNVTQVTDTSVGGYSNTGRPVKITQPEERGGRRAPADRAGELTCRCTTFSAARAATRLRRSKQWTPSSPRAARSAAGRRSAACS